MCSSCNQNNINYVSSKTCSGDISKLSNARNKLATLQNYVSDGELKAKYKKDKEEVDEILVQHALTKLCPDHFLVVTIENEVNNEYTKYY